MPFSIDWRVALKIWFRQKGLEGSGNDNSDMIYIEIKGLNVIDIHNVKIRPVVKKL